MRCGRDELRHGLGRRQAAGEQVEQEPAERRIGHVLRGGRAHLGARMRAAAPTAGLDDVTTMPKRPLVGQRAASENVTSAPRSRRPRRPTPGRASATHHEAREGREDAAQALAEHAVDRPRDSGCRSDTRRTCRCRRASRRTRSRSNSMLSIVLLGLRRRGRRSQALSRVSRSCADLPTQVNRVAGDDGLAEVVVEALLGVGVLGVERPDASVARSVSFPSSSTRSDNPAARCTCAQRSRPVEVAIDRSEIGEWRRLREQLERQPVAGVVGIEQVAAKASKRRRSSAVQRSLME